MKRLMKVAKVLAVLALAIALTIGIFDVVLGRRLEKQLLAIKASGAPVAMTEPGEPKVADSENGAIIYAKVIEGMTGMVLNPKGGKPIKAGTPPEDLDILDSFTSLSERSENPKLWDDMRPVVAKYSRLIPLIEQAASKPQCQFAVNWQDGAGALFPHFAPMRRIAKLLEANALLAARDGNMDEAVRSVELSFKVSRSLKDDPSLIGQLVRIAFVKISSRSLREILQSGSISEAQAKRLGSTLAQPGMLPSLDRAMLAERCCGLWAFELVRSRSSGMTDLVGSENGPRVFFALWKAFGDVWRPFSYADELIYLRLLSAETEAMRHPYRDVHDKAELADPTKQLPRYAIISRIMFPVFTRATAHRDDAIAEVGGSRILLGLQAYKDRYGYYPVSLQALKSQLGWAVPTDPFSGIDFIYRPKGNGFVLYSVGQNFKDDGAQVWKPKPQPAPEPGTPPAPAPGTPGPEDGTQIAAGYSYKNAKGEKVADIIWEMDH